MNNNDKVLCGINNIGELNRQNINWRFLGEKEKVTGIAQ